MAAPYAPFSGRAKNPDYQPIVDALIAYMRENQITANEFGVRLFGAHPRKPSQPARNNAVTYHWAHGESRPNVETAELIYEKTGVDLREWASPNVGPYGRTALVAHRKHKPAKPSARQALVEYERATDKDDGWKKLDPPRTKLGPPKFALVVQQDGTASMTMNLIDVDTDEAMRAFEAMKAIGLVKG